MREAIVIFTFILLLPVLGYVLFKSCKRMESNDKMLDNFVECLQEKRYVDAREHLYYSCVDDYNLFVTDLPILYHSYTIDVEVQNQDDSGCCIQLHFVIYDDMFSPSEKNYIIPIKYITYERGTRLITDVTGSGYAGTYSFKNEFNGQFFSIKDDSPVSGRGGYWDVYILKKKGSGKSVVALFGENEYYLYKVKNKYLKRTEDYRVYNLK